MSLALIRTAIETNKPISFSYNKPGKTPGTRTGNPHAVWVMQKKDGTEVTMVHIVQVDGVSDSGQELPSFRMFHLSDVGNVNVLNDLPEFTADERYNPEWNGYTFLIAKV